MLSVKQELSGQVVSGIADVTSAAGAAVKLAVYQRTVYATANTASDSFDLFLPVVQEAEGLTYVVHATIANSKAITLKTRGTVPGWSNLTLDTDNDHVVLYSDGRRWRVLLNGIA
jgi:hypothetical protein